MIALHRRNTATISVIYVILLSKNTFASCSHISRKWQNDLFKIYIRKLSPYISWRTIMWNMSIMWNMLSEQPVEDKEEAEEAVLYVGSQLEFCLLTINVCKEVLPLCGIKGISNSYCCRSSIFYSALFGGFGGPKSRQAPRGRGRRPKLL